MTNIFRFSYEEYPSKYWKNTIQYHLDGKLFSDYIPITSFEQPLKPFYSAENDFLSLNHSKNYRKTQPLVRVSVHNTTKTLRFIEEVSREISVDFFLIIYKPIVDIERLLKNLPEKNRYFITFDKLSWDEISKVVALTKNHNQITLCIDPLHQLMTSGNFFDNLTKDINALDEWKLPYFIDYSHYTHAGALIVQQIAYAVLQLQEYIKKRKYKPSSIVLKGSIGTAIFPELAKIRAIHFFMKQLVPSATIIEITEGTSYNQWAYRWKKNKEKIIVETQIANWAMTDYLLLKNPKELIQKPKIKNLFDDFMLYQNTTKNSTKNLFEGSYFYETLSLQFAKQAKELIDEISNHKGLIYQLLKGTIQSKIEKNATRNTSVYTEMMDAKERKRIEKSIVHKQKPTDLYPFVKYHSRKTLIKPLNVERLYACIEKEFYQI